MRHSGYRNLLIALAVLGTVFSAGCVSSSSSDRGLSSHLYAVRGTPSYIPADDVSCLALSIRQLDGKPVDRRPFLKSDLGKIRRLRPGAGKGEWTAELCAGTETGKVHLRALAGEIPEPPDLYFIPPEDYPSSEPMAVTSFTISVDPVAQTVSVRGEDVLDPYGIELSVYLYDSPPYLFQGNTVGIGVVVEGTQTRWDLLSVQAIILSVSHPGVKITNPDGFAEDMGGAPFFDYGGFLSTARALDRWGRPASWACAWFLETETAAPFTLAGAIRVRLPVPEDEQADFRIHPFQTRVARTGITLSWETDRESRSLVVYGTSPECENIALGASEHNQINEGRGWATPRFFDSFFHRVRWSGLEPNTVYYYRVLSVREPTEVRTFTTAAEPDTAFTFAVIGDTRTGHDSHAALIERMARFAPRFYLHVGDLVWWSCSEEEWLRFFQLEEPMLGRFPIFPTIGNHDAPCVDLFYERYFHPPVTPDFPADLRGQFYSFNFGSSHFVAVNTNLPYDPASPQYQWLVQDLEKAVRNPRRKFTFVF